MVSQWRNLLFLFQELIISLSLLCLSVSLWVLWCCNKCWAVFYSLWLPGSKICWFLVCTSSQVRQKQLPWAVPWKAGTLDLYSTLLFPSQWRSWYLGSSQSCWAMLALGKGYCGCCEMAFLTCFNVTVSTLSLPRILWLLNKCLEFS